MKSIILIAIGLLSLNALAVSTVSCDSINTEATLTLQIGLTNKVSSVRLQKDNTSTQSFLARFIKTSNNISIYSLSGTSDLLKIEESVVNYGFGRADIGKLRFSCN